MKVLYLTYSPSPYRVEFFEELGKKVELTVCYETTPKEDKTKRNKLWYNTTNQNFQSIYLKNKYILGKRISFDVIKILKKKKYDIIVIAMYNTLTSIVTTNYLRRKRIPFIISTDGGFIKEKEFIFMKFIKTYLIKRGEAFLVSGNNAKKYFCYYGASEKKTYLYPFTSLKKDEILKRELTKKEKDIIKRALNIKEKYIVVAVGQFIYRKGFDILIQACKGLSNDIGVLIIGDRPTNEYNQLVKKVNQQNIHFIDFKPKKELIEYLKMADVFVLPTREDIYGLAVVEALSLGLPVITTNQCGAGLDLIQNGYNGYIFKSENIEELNRILTTIFLDEQKLQKMSINSLSSIANYTIENEAAIHFDIFEKIMKSRDNNEKKC